MDGVLTPGDVGLPEVPEPDLAPDVIVPIAPTNPFLADPAAERLPPELGVVPAPVEPAAPFAAAPLSPGAPQQPADPRLQSVSVETRGLTDSGLQRSRGVMQRAEANADAFSEQSAAETNAQMAAVDANYAERARAAEEEADINRLYGEAQQGLQTQLAELARANAEAAERIKGEAEEAKALYLAKYDEERAAVRQLTAQSGSMFAKMDGWQAIGTAAAQFAQGMLAARGVQIDVNGQLDKMAERAMQEHRNKISDARAAADEQLSLWEVARKDSNDDYEALQKYRGYMMEAVQTQLAANAAKFNSGLAASHARANAAKLQTEADATKRALGDAHHKRVFDYLEAERRSAVDTAKLGLEWSALKLQRDKEAFDQAHSKTATPKLQPIVIDTSDVQTDPETGKPISGGKVVAIYNTDSPGVAKAQQEIAEATKMHDLATERIAHLASLKPDGIPWPKFMANKTSPEYRRWDTARGLFLADLIKLKSGTAASEKEVERLSGAVRDDKMWERGSNKDLMIEMTSATRANLRATINSHIGTNILKVDSIDGRYGANKNGYMPRIQPSDEKGAQNYFATVHGEKPAHTLVSSIASGIGARGDDEVAGKASSAFKEYVGSHGDRGQLYSDKGMEAPQWASKLESLARIAADPTTYKKQYEQGVYTAGAPPESAPQSAEQTAVDAAAAIRAVRQSGDRQRAGYAKYLENLLQDPATARKLLLGEKPKKGR